MAAWLLLLFALELLLAKHRGDFSDVIVEREARVFGALVQFGMILVGYLYLFCKQGLTGRIFPVEKKARPVFLLLGLWSGLALVATLEGFLFENDANYAIGDLYKFALLPLLFGLAYFGVQNQQQLERVLKGLVIIFGFFLVYDFVHTVSFLQQGHRFTASSTYYLATMVPLLIYSVFRRSVSRGFCLVAAVVVAEALLAVVLLQGLSDYLFFFLGLVLFLVFWRRMKLAFAATLVIALTVAGIWDVFGLFGRQGTYAKHKLEAASSSRTVEEVVERLSGSRLGEIASISRSYRAEPAKLPFGFGMGSYVEAQPVGLGWARWQIWIHFIHSGLFETLYRAGLAGTATLLAFLAYVFYRGQQLSLGPYRDYGVFVMVNALYQAANLSIQSPITYPWLILSVSLVGTYVLERNKKWAPRRMQYESRHHL